MLGAKDCQRHHLFMISKKKTLTECLTFSFKTHLHSDNAEMGKIMPLGTGDIPCSDLTHLGGDKRWGRCPCLSPGFEGSRGRTRVFFSYTPVPKVHFSLSFHVVMFLREDTVLPDPSPRSHGADTDPECSPGASTSLPLNGQAEPRSSPSVPPRGSGRGHVESRDDLNTVPPGPLQSCGEETLCSLLGLALNFNSVSAIYCSMGPRQVPFL